MHSDFSAARLFLERAFIALRGADEFSIQAREALTLLIGACAGKEPRPLQPSDVPAGPEVPAGDESAKAGGA